MSFLAFTIWLLSNYKLHFKRSTKFWSWFGLITHLLSSLYFQWVKKGKQNKNIVNLSKNTVIITMNNNINKSSIRSEPHRQILLLQKASPTQSLWHWDSANINCGTCVGETNLYFVLCFEWHVRGRQICPNCTQAGVLLENQLAHSPNLSFGYFSPFVIK